MTRGRVHVSTAILTRQSIITLPGRVNPNAIALKGARERLNADNAKKCHRKDDKEGHIHHERRRLFQAAENCLKCTVLSELAVKKAREHFTVVPAVIVSNLAALSVLRARNMYTCLSLSIPVMARLNMIQ